MTLVAILLLAYLFVAPDKTTLKGTRGVAGALRAALGMPAAGARSRSKKSSSSHSKSSGRRPLLAGWREGVSAARKAREDGRDLWSRGSRASGRVAGGTRNVVGGVRTAVRARRDRRHQSGSPSPDAQPVVADPDVESASGKDDQVHAGLEQHLDDSGAPTWPAAFKKAADLSGPDMHEGDEARRSQDGEILFSSKSDDLGAAIGQSAHPAHSEEKTGDPNNVESHIRLNLTDRVTDVAAEVIGSSDTPTAIDEELAKAPADSRYYVWTSPDSGQFFVFDRMNLDEPMPATDEHAAALWADFYNSRHDLATQNGEPAAALADIPKTGGAGGAFDKNGEPWAFVKTDAYFRTCPKCGSQTERVDDSFDADEKSSTWSNVYHCPNCGEKARFVTPLTASEHRGLFNGRSRREDAFAISSLGPSSSFEASQTPAATAAAGNTNPSTTPRKETTPMAIAGTELGNLDEVDGEAKAALNAIEALTEALNEIKGWGGNLPERWSGTSWSTDGLDAAIVGVAEAAAELKIPEGLMEQLTQIGAEVTKARAVGEVAAETGAKGDLSGFRSN